MKKLLVVAGLVLIAGLCAGILGRGGINFKTTALRAIASHTSAPSVPQDPAPVITSLVDSVEINPGRPGVLTLAGETQPAERTNSLPGHCIITIRFNRATAAVIGGDWTLTVFQANDAGETVPVGAIHGTLSGGTVSLDAAGRATGVNGVGLSVVGGNAAYSSVNAGSGSFEAEPGAASPQNQSNVSASARMIGSDARAGLREVSPKNAEPVPQVPGSEGAPRFKGKLNLSF